MQIYSDDSITIHHALFILPCLPPAAAAELGQTSVLHFLGNCSLTSGPHLPLLLLCADL